MLLLETSDIYRLTATSWARIQFWVLTMTRSSPYFACSQSLPSGWLVTLQRRPRIADAGDRSQLEGSAFMIVLVGASGFLGSRLYSWCRLHSAPFFP